MWTRERSKTKIGFTAHVDAKIRQLRGRLQRKHSIPSVMSGMSGTSIKTHEAASSTCPVVSTLVEGGATCLGKTAVDQLAFRKGHVVWDGLPLVSVFCLCNGHDDPEEGEAFSVVSFVVVVVVVFSVYDLGNMATLFKFEDRVELFDGSLVFDSLLSLELYLSCLLFFLLTTFKLMMMIFLWKDKSN
ncbi:unnamed protein product [Brassica oleracea]